MRVRIISGIYGGRMLDAPDTERTHPMGERVRSALFNILGGEVQGATVLDAFAGSGSVGLEALSRGASHATFVERDRIAAKVLRANIALLGCDEKARVIQAGVGGWVDSSAPQLFDIIFADPPYHDPQFSTITRLFAYLKPGGCMILSHPGSGEVPAGVKGIVVVDNRSYGNAYLTIFRREIEA